MVEQDNKDNDDGCEDILPDTCSIQDIFEKLKELNKNFKFNNLYEKKPDCFWCHYFYNNPTIYIPSYECIHNPKVNNFRSYEVYGGFCSPQCAVAYLNQEKIDTTTKFQRIELLNYLYGDIYHYSSKITPAPSPYYLLEKYYGSLTIDEYRKLSTENTRIMIIDKPITRVYPELHQENTEKTISFNTLSNETKVNSKKDISKTKILDTIFN